MNEQAAGKLMPVLLAEDEQADVFLMKRAFRLAEVANPLVTVPDEPMDFTSLLALVQDLKRDWLEPMLSGHAPVKKHETKPTKDAVKVPVPSARPAPF